MLDQSICNLPRQANVASSVYPLSQLPLSHFPAPFEVHFLQFEPQAKTGNSSEFK